MQENQNTTYSSAHLQTLRSNRTPHYVRGPIDYEFPVKDSNMDEFYRITEDWVQRLKILRCVGDGADEAHENWVEEFTRFLIENQRVEDKTSRMNAEGSWAIPENADMESDVRIDFVYFPTYIATAFLCLLKQDMPTIASKFVDFDDVLKKGLDFSSRRNLQGHGYEMVQESLTAIEYLSLGKVFSYSYTQKHQKASIKFNRAIGKARDEILSKLRDNRGWSSIDEERSALSLKLLDGDDVDDQLVCDSPNSYWKSKERKAIVGELVDETLLIIASRFVPEIQHEIGEREIELLGIADGVRPTHAVFKRAGREAYSDDIKLNTKLSLSDIIDELRGSVGDIPSLLAHVNSKEYIDDLNKIIGSALRVYIDSRDMDNEFLTKNHVSVGISKCVLVGDILWIYIILSVSFQ